MTDQYDLSQLVLPTVEVKDIVSHFKQLSRYEEFTTYPLEEDRNRIVKYINYLYSVKSPLIRTYKNDLATRKEEAAILAGYDIKKEIKWIEDNLYLLKNDGIVHMIVRFLIMQNVDVWKHICSYEQTAAQATYFILRLTKEDSEKDNADVLKRKQDMNDRNVAISNTLDGLYDKLFADSEDVKDYYRKKEEVRFNFTSPETVSRMPLQERPETKQSF